jgi:hypothetical protein
MIHAGVLMKLDIENVEKGFAFENNMLVRKDLYDPLNNNNWYGANDYKRRSFSRKTL